MPTRNNFGRFLAFFLWVVMAMPGVVAGQKAAEAKVDPPRAGMNGVTSPRCIYCPQPEYSQKLRKVKIEGVVLLDVTVTIDGRVANPVVLKGPDVDLNEKALEMVRNWKMKTGAGAGWQTCRLPCTSRNCYPPLP
jgi:TonB family protein